MFSKVSKWQAIHILLISVCRTTFRQPAVGGFTPLLIGKERDFPLIKMQNTSCQNYNSVMLASIILKVHLLRLALVVYKKVLHSIVVSVVDTSAIYRRSRIIERIINDTKNLRRIPLKARAITAKIIYFKSTHSSLTFSILFKISHCSSFL